MQKHCLLKITNCWGKQNTVVFYGSQKISGMSENIPLQAPPGYSLLSKTREKTNPTQPGPFCWRVPGRILQLEILPARLRELSVPQQTCT